MLNPSVFAEHFRRRNSLPSTAIVPPARATDRNSVQRLKSPLMRNHSINSAHVAAPQTPKYAGGSNAARPINVVEDSQDQDQVMKPQHIFAPSYQMKPSVLGQSMPAPRLPQNILAQGKVPPNETPSLESSSISENDPPVGFFTARAAESLQNSCGLALKAPAFNPHLESPSIRKTAGVDHTKTKPVGREAVGAPSQPTGPRVNFVNPQSDRTRRVGMPIGAASPVQNRGSYKPPQMKRPVENSGPRSALGDVTNVDSDTGENSKRQKIGLEAQGAHSNGEIL